MRYVIAFLTTAQKKKLGISLAQIPKSYRLRLLFGDGRKYSSYQNTDKSHKGRERYSDDGVPGKNQTWIKTV